MAMNKMLAKKWLDSQIEAMYLQHQAYGNLQNISRSDTIHIDKWGLEDVVNLLGLPVTFVDRKNDIDYPFQAEFEYNGVIFIALLSSVEKECFKMPSEEK